MAKGIKKYYTEKVIRKMFGYAHYSGLLKEEKQKSLIGDLIQENPLEFELEFQAKFISAGFLKDFRRKLVFVDEIAVGEHGGEMNPLTPATYALFNYNKYVDSSLDEDYLEFHKHWEFLEANRLTNKSGSYWEYTHDFKRFNLTSPWVSGLAQAMIASVYLRKFIEEKNNEHLKIAKECIDFCYHQENGLYTSIDGGKKYWIEEYPGEKGKGVLNGYLFFLIALAELTTFDESYTEKLQLGLETVLTFIPDYHKGKYLRYSTNIPDLANRHYQEIHAYQLEHLFKLTRAKVFESLRIYWMLLSGVDTLY